MPKKRFGKACARLHIRDLDKKLFSYLFVNKVATSLQIARDVYGGISHQALYKRLNKLIHFGYLQGNYHKELGGRLVYSLSTMSFKDFVSSGRDIQIRKQLKSDSILHDLDLVDIRSRFKGIKPVTQYYTENVLRSGTELHDDEKLRAFRMHHFDAVISLERQNGSQLLALEYERTCKFASRYQSYFKQVYVNSEIPAVLFICHEVAISKRVGQLERSVLANYWPKFFYAHLSDALKTEGPLTFKNLNQETITLR